MKIFLRGGPRDGEYISPPTDSDGIPLELTQFPPPLSVDPPLIGNGSDAFYLEQDILIYKLERIMRDGKLHHYEYHYQGR